MIWGSKPQAGGVVRIAPPTPFIAKPPAVGGFVRKGLTMYGYVICLAPEGRKPQTFAAVSHNRKALETWFKDTRAGIKANAADVYWRFRGRDGWEDGDADAWKVIPDFPVTAQVLWR